MSNYIKIHGITYELVRTHFDNGNLKSEECFFNGLKYRTSKYYHENGKLSFSANYSEDKLDGIKKYFNEKGKLVTEESYDKGEKKKVKHFYESGVLRGEITYGYYGEYHTYYFENGGKRSDMRFKDGLKESVTTYYENGCEKKHTSYKNGEIDFVRNYDENCKDKPVEPQQDWDTIRKRWFGDGSSANPLIPDDYEF